MRRTFDGERVGGDIFRDDAARADIRAVADLHGRDECCVGTDERARADIGEMLVEAVVITGDGPCADIRARADARIADISEVVRFRALLDARILNLDEISDMDILFDLCAGPQPRERSDNRALRDLCAFEMRERTNLRAAPHHHTRPEHDIGSDLAIRFQNRVGLKKHGLRRNHSNARLQRTRTQTALHRGFGLRQFGTTVHAHDSFLIRIDHGATDTFRLRKRWNIGQVIFSLRIVVLQKRSPAEKRFRIRRQNACIAQRDRALALIRILEFDNAVEQTIAPDDHAAISLALRLERDERHARASARRERIRENLRRHERHVAIGDDDRAVEPGQRARRAIRGMARAQLAILNDGLGLRARRIIPHRHAIGRCHHDDASHPRLAHGIYNVAQDRHPRHAVQHLRDARAHARALACRKDDGGALIGHRASMPCIASCPTLPIPR